LRLGIVPALKRFGGGTYQYSLTMLDALQTLQHQGLEDDLIIFCNESEKMILQKYFREANWRIVSLDYLLRSIDRSTWKGRLSTLAGRLAGEGTFSRALSSCLRTFKSMRGMRMTSPSLDAIRYRPKLALWIDRQGIELMLYLAPKTLSFETGLPYVMAVHDLQHRLQPEFPEVSANGEWERREYLFRNGIRYATLILVDSEVGKEDVLRFYEPFGVTHDRVKVLPFLPSHYLRTKVPEIDKQFARRAYGVPERYFFYPAQFWPHKNHTRIVQAIGLLKARHRLKVDVVFCGSHTGEIREKTFQEVHSLAKKLEVEKQVYYLGYVPDEDMPALYAASVGLIMPTFFGPTNIPVQEAWMFGCPVITSDIRGIREQVGDAGILVDPCSVEAIADGIYCLWTDENLCNKLAENGRKRLATYTLEDYCMRLKQVLEEAKARVREAEATLP